MKPTDRVDAGDTPKLIPPLADAAVALLRWAAHRTEPRPQLDGAREISSCRICERDESTACTTCHPRRMRRCSGFTTSFGNVRSTL